MQSSLIFQETVERILRLLVQNPNLNGDGFIPCVFVKNQKKPMGHFKILPICVINFVIIYSAVLFLNPKETGDSSTS